MGETCINKPTNMHKHYCNEIFFLPLLLMLLHGLLVIFENCPEASVCMAGVPNGVETAAQEECGCPWQRVVIENMVGGRGQESQSCQSSISDNSFEATDDHRKEGGVGSGV